MSSFYGGSAFGGVPKKKPWQSKAAGSGAGQSSGQQTPPPPAAPPPPAPPPPAFKPPPAFDGKYVEGAKVGPIKEPPEVVVPPEPESVPPEPELAFNSEDLFNDINNTYNGSLQDALTAAGQQSSLQGRRLNESMQGSALGGAAQSTMATAQIGAQQGQLDAKMQWASKGLEMKMALLQQALGSEEAQLDRDLKERIQAEISATNISLERMRQGDRPILGAEGNIIDWASATDPGAEDPAAAPANTGSAGMASAGVSAAQTAINAGWSGQGDPMDMSGPAMKAVADGLSDTMYNDAAQRLESFQVNHPDLGTDAAAFAYYYVTWIAATEGRIATRSEIEKFLGDRGYGSETRYTGG